MAASRTVDPLAASKFWESDGSLPSYYTVKRKSLEGRALADYFLKSMPEDVDLRHILRIESRQPWRHYKIHRNDMYERLQNHDDIVEHAEMYLWHGTDCSYDTVERGFSNAHTNLGFNMYGAGFYFAVDPKMAHYFIRNSRKDPSSECTVLLSRVAVGKCAEKKALPQHVSECRHFGKTRSCNFSKCEILRLSTLRKTEHRQPPDGYDSCTSQDRLEVIVYDRYHAYPAYMFVYQCASLARFNPYSNKDRLAKLNFDCRSDHTVDFESYRNASHAGSSITGNPPSDQGAGDTRQAKRRKVNELYVVGTSTKADVSDSSVTDCELPSKVLSQPGPSPSALAQRMVQEIAARRAEELRRIQEEDQADLEYADFGGGWSWAAHMESLGISIFNDD
eukprot:TRINITY_DN109824_c0_g1_i1.p1 TRINITY_DN109824_c0_g1~~TRINITY_DN109824_c0_g1_i1.p1  ORF type:complete len:392 (-),score=36.18 TRINITY_DN109824_c0_g1_i1:112-1287(-)